MSNVFVYADLDDYNTYEHEGKTYHEVDAKMLWSLTHLDGVMSGIAAYKGQICYAKCHQCYDTRAPRGGQNRGGNQALSSHG